MVGAAHGADIDVCGEVARVFVADVEYGDEGAARGGGEAGNAISVDAFVALAEEDGAEEFVGMECCGEE